MLLLFSSGYLIQSTKRKPSIHNHGSASRNLGKSPKGNGHQNPWTADKPRLDNPPKKTDPNPCRHSNDTLIREPWPCWNHHGPSKIPFNIGSPFCQSSQPRKLPSKHTWKCGTRSTSKSGSRTQRSSKRVKNFLRSCTGNKRHNPGDSCHWIPNVNQRHNPRIPEPNAHQHVNAPAKPRRSTRLCGHKNFVSWTRRKMMQMKFHKSTSIELKKQFKNLLAPESTPISTNVMTWLFTT